MSPAVIDLTQCLVHLKRPVPGLLPIGNTEEKVEQVSLTPEEIGKLVRSTRKRMGVTLADLALTAGTGLRFVIDLEKGKTTCQIGKVLTVLQTLGIEANLSPPAPEEERG